MAPTIPPEAIDAVRREIPPEIYEAMIERELAIRSEARRAERIEKRDLEGAAKRGEPYRRITSGRARRSKAPVAKVEDRQYVPGALRHWRKVHGLTFREAQRRCGYSVGSSIWRHWEDGHVAPPYKALLAMLAATGMDPAAAVADHASGLTGDLRLEAQRVEHQRIVRERRRARRVPVAA